MAKLGNIFNKEEIKKEEQLSSSRDSDIDGLKRICDIIHKNGSTAILQISHAGCGASRDFTGEQPVSSSNISVTCGWPNAKPNPILRYLGVLHHSFCHPCKDLHKNLLIIFINGILDNCHFYF